MDPRPVRGRRTLRALAWSSAGTGITFASNIVAMIWLSRILGPKIVGASAAVLAICTIFRATLLVPIIQATVTDPGQSVAFRRSAEVLSVGLGVTGAACLTLGSVAMSGLVDVPRFPQMAAVGGLSIAAASVGCGSFALLQRELRFRVLSAYQACGAVVGSLVVAPVLAYSDLRPISLLAAALVAASIETLGALWSTRSTRAARRPDDSTPVRVREVANASSGFAAVGVTSSLALQGDTLVVAATLGSGSAGLYSRAYRLMALPANLLGDIADAVLLSAGTQASLRRLRRAFDAGSLLALIVTWPAALIGVVTADDLVAVLLGAEWQGSAPVLKALCIGLPFRVAYKGPAVILNVRRRSWALTVRLAAYATLVIGLSLVGAEFGLVWVGVGVSASLVTFHLLVSRAAARDLSVPNHILGDNLLAVGLSLPAAAAALATHHAADGLPAFVRLTLTLAAGLVGIVAAWVPAWRWPPPRIRYVKEVVARNRGADDSPRSPLEDPRLWNVEGAEAE